MRPICPLMALRKVDIMGSSLQAFVCVEIFYLLRLISHTEDVTAICDVILLFFPL